MRMGEAGDDHRMGGSYTYHFQNVGSWEGSTRSTSSVTMKIRVYQPTGWSGWTKLTKGWSGWYDMTFESDTSITTTAPVTEVQVQFSSKYYTFTNGMTTSHDTTLNFDSNYSYSFEYIVPSMYLFLYTDTSYHNSQGYKSLSTYTTTL